MRYFVTGATGFLGGRLVRQSREAGHEVAALVRDPGKADDLRRLGAELHRGDITERDSLRAPMMGADGVYYLAAWYKVRAKNNAMAEAVNVGGTRNVLEVMRDLGIPKGVYTNTLAVFSDNGGKLVDEFYRHDGPWLSVYDRTKWQAHYQVAAGLCHSFLEAMGMAQEITGVKPPSFHPGPGLLKEMAGMMKVVGSVVPLPDAYTAESIRVIAGVYIGDNSKARRELGYNPRPLREGLRETLAWEMEQLEMAPHAAAGGTK